MAEERSRYDKLVKDAVYFSQRSFSDDFQQSALYLHGTLNIVEHPEFTDIRKMKNLLVTLEEKGRLLKILNRVIGIEDVNVLIGSENESRGFEDCSIITGAYSYKDTALGSLAILGPTRMKYARTIALVDYFSKTLSCTLA
jgi:heat-inducible transcriptional repressor